VKTDSDTFHECLVNNIWLHYFLSISTTSSTRDEKLIIGENWIDEVNIMNISEKIRTLRKRKGLTQEQLGDLLGVSYMTVRRWETGKTSPKIKKIKKMSEILETSTEYLMNELDEVPLTKTLSNVVEALKNVPINNMKEHKEHIDMAYWGGVLDNAVLVARRGDKKEISLIKPLLSSALEAISDEPVTNCNQSPVGIKVQGNKNNIEDNYISIGISE